MDLFNQHRIVDVGSADVHDRVFKIMTQDFGFADDPRSKAIEQLCRELTVQVVKNMTSSKNVGQSRCSVCTSPLEAYKRPINVGNIRAMLKIKESGGGPLHINQMNVAGGDFTKLKHWGLIRHVVSMGTSQGWALTDKGRSFLNGDISVWRSVWLFKGKVIGFEPITASVRDAKPHSKKSLRAEDKDKIVLI